MSGSYYSRNPHDAAGNDNGNRELLAAYEKQAGDWFSALAGPQQARFNQRMSDAFPYRGAPKWDREREAAMREFTESTTAAARVSDMVLADLLATGEISEATNDAYHQVLIRQVMAEAAE